MSEVLAGKIGVTNGGEWNSETYYEEATFVRHQNNLYLSNLPSTGVEPTNEEYWMLAMEGFSGEDVQTLIDSINNIIDGTTQVGNAKTLDGHGADDFLPKTGGTITGDVTQQTADTRVMHNLKNNKRRVYQEIDANGVYTLFDGTNSSSVIRSTAEGANTFNGHSTKDLPLDGGGTITSPHIAPIVLKNSVGSACFTGYYSTNGELGYMGVDGNEKPTFQKKDGTKTEMFHVGNKPTGTYTGNGDATERTIATGSSFPYYIISSSNGILIVTPDGCFGSDGTTTIRDSRAYSSGSNIVVKSSSPLLNAEGVTYKYLTL